MPLKEANSAAKLLLEARRKQREQELNLTKSTLIKSVEQIDPLEAQIGGTLSDSEQYLFLSNGRKLNNIKRPNKEMHAISTNSKKKKVESGENYKSKLLERTLAKTHRQQRIKNMKKLY